MYVSCAGTLTLPEERRLPQRFNASDLSSCRSNRRKDWFLGGWCGKVTLGVDVASPFQSLPEPMDIPGIGGTETRVTFPSLPLCALALRKSLRFLPLVTGQQWMPETSYAMLKFSYRRVWQWSLPIWLQVWSEKVPKYWKTWVLLTLWTILNIPDCGSVPNIA